MVCPLVCVSLRIYFLFHTEVNNGVNIIGVLIETPPAIDVEPIPNFLYEPYWTDSKNTPK